MRTIAIRNWQGEPMGIAALWGNVSNIVNGPDILELGAAVLQEKDVLFTLEDIRVASVHVLEVMRDEPAVGGHKFTLHAWSSMHYPCVIRYDTYTKTGTIES
ncbi:hypothetical protein HGB13_01700 [bacterium]|nr:hypothetical protein [bacterium]